LSDYAKQLLLTRVTVPIDYKDPRLVMTISTKRDELKAKGVPEERIKNEVKELVDNWTGKPEAYTIGFLGQTLLSHSAQKIYLVDLGRKLNDSILAGLPDVLKPRIEFVDKDYRIQKSVFRMLEPIGNELDVIWEEVRKKTGASAHAMDGHEHAYCSLGEFLITLTLASKYNTEADIDFDLVKLGTDRIRRQIKSAESKAIISRIEGILNCYEISRQIPSVIPTIPIVPNDLLKDLLDDCNIIALSKERYFLGVPSKFKVAITKMKRKIREILVVPRNRKYLAMAGRWEI
jgi:hypothetical protein